MQGQLKELVRRRSSIEDFSRHVRRSQVAYRLEDALLALNGLQQESVLPAEEIHVDKKTGTTARAARDDSASYAPIQLGLNVLLWEQAIREGGFSTGEKERVRRLYLAHAQHSLFRQSKETDIRMRKKEHERFKGLESSFNQAALELADLDGFDAIRSTAEKVHSRVRTALGRRMQTPHRYVMNRALESFNNLLVHLDSVRQFKDELRDALGKKKPIL